jgi:hypothetical protein
MRWRAGAAGPPIHRVRLQLRQPALDRVRLVVPNPAIELDAFGLKSQPYGSLLLVENPGSTPGTGELDIAPGGTFQAYGQNLTLDAMHLASALAARSVLPDLVLLSLDERMRAAGRGLGFTL